MRNWIEDFVTLKRSSNKFEVSTSVLFSPTGGLYEEMTVWGEGDQDLTKDDIKFIEQSVQMVNHYMHQELLLQNKLDSVVNELEEIKKWNYDKDVLFRINKLITDIKGE